MLGSLNLANTPERFDDITPSNTADEETSEKAG